MLSNVVDVQVAFDRARALLWYHSDRSVSLVFDTSNRVVGIEPRQTCESPDSFRASAASAWDSSFVDDIPMTPMPEMQTFGISSARNISVLEKRFLWKVCIV